MNFSLGPPPARPTAPKPGNTSGPKPSPGIDPVLLQSLNLNEYDVDPKLMPTLLGQRSIPPTLLDPKFNPPPELLDPRAPGSVAPAPDASAPVDPRVQALREATLAAMGGGGGSDYSAPKPSRSYGLTVASAGGAASRLNNMPVAPALAPAADFKPKLGVTSSAAKPPAAAPGGPTLADYLPFIKPKTFGEQKAGNCS